MPDAQNHDRAMAALKHLTDEAAQLMSNWPDEWEWTTDQYSFALAAHEAEDVLSRNGGSQ